MDIRCLMMSTRQRNISGDYIDGDPTEPEIFNVKQKIKKNDNIPINTHIYGLYRHFSV